jgi:hypothetical protein
MLAGSDPRKECTPDGSLTSLRSSTVSHTHGQPSAATRVDGMDPWNFPFRYALVRAWPTLLTATRVSLHFPVVFLSSYFSFVFYFTNEEMRQPPIIDNFRNHLDL